MTTHLSSSEVSAQHLAISWDGQCWTVRDLSSRNGTWLNGRRLGTGEIVPMQKGAVLLIGSPLERWTLEDDAPPAPRAQTDDQMIEGQKDFLAIPTAENPIALVLFDPDEGWILSVGTNTTPIRDGHEVVAAGQRWRISLPEAMERTTNASTPAPQVHDLSLHFKVSANEEYVELTVHIGDAQHRLPARAHHYLLLILARARIGDTNPIEAERGWLYTEDLVRMLRQSSNQIYVSLHRVRKEFEALGISDGGLIERRATTHQLRVRPSHLQVEGF